MLVKYLIITVCVSCVSQVRSSYQGGRYMDSVNASQSSLFFNRLSIFVGIIGWIIVVLLSLCYYFFVIESLRNKFMQLNL